MRQLKAKEWLQLTLMFPLAFWGSIFLGKLGSSGFDNMSISSADVCYTYLYTYSGQEPYIAALCAIPNEGIAIIRVQADSLALVATNHAVDVLIIGLLFIVSILSWLLFLKRVAAVYVPGL